MQDYMKVLNFQPLEMMPTSIRVLSAILLHRSEYAKLQYSIKFLTYLKRERDVNRARQKWVTLLVLTMKIIAPIIAIITLMITAGQEPSANNLIKNYVTIGLIMNIESIFSDSIPRDVHEIVKRINTEGGLLIPPDENTWKHSLDRIRQNKDKSQRLKILAREAQTTLINLYFHLIVNFQVIVYNYFGPIVILGMQIIMFYQQLVDERKVSTDTR